MSHRAPDTADGRRDASFDTQATEFDRRAGLPEAARKRVARAIIDIGRLRPSDTGGRLLDVGAGTGEIGAELIEHGVEYVGIDESAAMLEVFRGRVTTSPRPPTLVVADARDRWPIDDRSTRVVFGSRSLHWLPPGHVAAEALRVASPPFSVLLVGRVERDLDGPRERVRLKMRELLREAGFEGRSAERSGAAITAELVGGGATAIPPRIVASWSVQRPPRAALDDWGSKPGLAGVDVPEVTKDAVLVRVAKWATATFGDIDTPLESTECYTLAGAILVGATEPAERT